MEPVTRSECKESMDRFHTRIDEIQKSVIRMEESTKRIEKFGEDIHKLLYGNGNNGFITTTAKKFTQLFERISLHTKILVGTFFCGVFAGLVAFIMKYATK